MATVIFVLDAFRASYISKENTPYLWDMKKHREFYKVKPAFGFCERSEIFSGLTPEESNNFTAIGYDPLNSPYKNIRHFFYFINKILPKNQDNHITKFSRKVINKVCKSLNFSLGLYRIPLSDICDYRLTEDRYELTSNKNDAFLPFIKSIGKKEQVFTKSFTSLNDNFSLTDEERLNICLDNAKNDDFSHYIVYVSAADTIGHKFGPDSEEMKDCVSNIDRNLKSFIKEFTLARPKSRFVFIGDHGMANVKRKINIQEIVDEIIIGTGLKYRKDITYFLDSTLARFWFKDKQIEKTFLDEFYQVDNVRQHGVIIKRSDFNKYGIPSEDRLYGDVIWSSNIGGLIWPDFFHNNVNQPPVGMHGYFESNEELIGFYMDISSNKKTTKSSINLHNTFDLIRK
ncbi:alkaline phosphatase family protein [Vibrio harveyi]